MSLITRLLCSVIYLLIMWLLFFITVMCEFMYLFKKRRPKREAEDGEEGELEEEDIEVLRLVPMATVLVS